MQIPFPAAHAQLQILNAFQAQRQRHAIVFVFAAGFPQTTVGWQPGCVLLREFGQVRAADFFFAFDHPLDR